jgi:hypothetical protein
MTVPERMILLERGFITNGKHNSNHVYPSVDIGLLRTVGVENTQFLCFVLSEVKGPMFAGKNHLQRGSVSFSLNSSAIQRLDHIKFILEATHTSIEPSPFTQYRTHGAKWPRIFVTN